MSCVDKYFDRVTVTMYSHEEQVLFRSEGAVISGPVLSTAKLRNLRACDVIY
jgi:hypothetical protein